MQSQRPRKQRNRISFSCTNCRQGKYRCDRRTPCSTCMRRDTEASCQYEEAAVLSSRRNCSTNERNLPSKKGSPADSQRSASTATTTPDLNIFGYSKTGANHTLAILNELSRVDSASSTLQNDPERRAMSRSPSQNDNYLRLLRGLPPRLYVKILVEIFFEQVNWQYSITDRNYFMPQLEQFYEATRSLYSGDQAGVSPEIYTFPALLFQVVGCAFQFIPPDYDQSLDDMCMGRSFDDLAKSYSDSGVEMLALFEKESLNLISVQAGFLRITLLKSFGYVVEAYRMVGQMVTDSEEIGLNLEDDSLEVGSVENTPPRLWYHEMRRRVMINLWLWDAQMSIILGKPSRTFAANWSLTLPLDAPIPTDTTTSIPTARPPSSRPTQFTHRMLEYYLLSQLPEMLKLLSNEFNLKDYMQIQANDQKVHDLIADFPPAFRFGNPDRQWDEECPWLKIQREYTCSTTQLVFLVMHRYSMFHVASSRTETIKSAVEVLLAQERHFNTLSPQHYKLYALAFFVLEAATAIMVVFIAYPTENQQIFEPTMKIVKQGIARLNAVKASNALARPAAELLELLCLRAESIHRTTLSTPPPISQPSTSTMSQESISSMPDLKPAFPIQEGDEAFDFSEYTPYQALTLDQMNAGSDTSTPPFDISCGGIIGQYGPVATAIDGNFYGVPDTWDPMILLERDNGGFLGGYGEDVY